jgi:NADPH:quinone reductase-like Zn-dependent oxidoreductase
MQKPGFVLVRVVAAAINPVDFKRPGIPVMGWGLCAPVGQDFSGVIVESASAEYAVGDAVFGKCTPSGSSGGCLAEYCAASAAAVARKPAGLSHVDAAALVTAGLTSLQALRWGGAALGSRVLVVGASGGCGSLGVQLARILVGPGGVVGAICSAHSAEFVRGLDPAVIVGDYGDPGSLLAEGGTLASSAPFDCLYDTVSSRDVGDGLGGQPYDTALAPLLRSATEGGRVVAINGTVSRWAARLVGWEAPGFHLLMQRDSAVDLAELAAWAAQGRLRVYLDGGAPRPFTAAGCAEAFERLKSRRSRGRIVVQVASEPASG